MKNHHLSISFAIFLCFFGHSILAQKVPQSNQPFVDCGTPVPSREFIQATEKSIAQLKQGGNSNAPPSLVNIPVKAHIVRQTDGTGGLSVSALNAAIAAMNTKYTATNLQFYLCGSVHYIDDDDLSDCDIDTDNARLVQNNVNDALNIYFTGSLRAGNSLLNGISAFPSGNASANRIVMWNNAVPNGSTLSHEVGHYWNLYHTHETAVANELVTRGTGANCSSAGDLVCDTPADPCCYFYNSSTCTYTGTGTDANGAPYSPLINNLMSYYTECRTTFTTGQHNRMGDGYAYRLSLMQMSGAYTFSCQSVAIAEPTNVSVATNSSTCSRTITWTDNSTNENGFIVERSTSATSGFVAAGTVAANVRSFTDTSPVLGAPVYYRVVAANGNATPSTVVQVASCGTVTAQYCLPGSTDCGQGDAIISFALKSSVGTMVTNASGCGSGGYSDFTSLTSATLTAGQTYSVVVTNQNQYPEGFTTWIDYDRDTTFSATEIAFKSATTTKLAVQHGTFTVPSTALGGLTRLRVRQSDNTNGVPGSPCASYAYGETEDYTLFIVPANANGPVASIKSGNWSDPTTWSTNQLPTVSNEVTISSNHVVTLNGIVGQAKNLRLTGKILYQNNGKLRLGQ